MPKLGLQTFKGAFALGLGRYGNVPAEIGQNRMELTTMMTACLVLEEETPPDGLIISLLFVE